MRQDEAEAYLIDSGWRRMGDDARGVPTWEDSWGSVPRAGKLSEGVVLPQKDGADPLVIRQLIVPPAIWTHSQEDAVTAQRQRDAAANGHKKEAAAAVA